MEIPPPPINTKTPTQQLLNTVSPSSCYSPKGEYAIWAMKMEHYLAHTDYLIWEVIQNGNGPVFPNFEELTRSNEYDIEKGLKMAIRTNDLPVNKWNATTATKQGILQESVEQRKITGGGMDGILEIKMGAELERKKSLKHWCIVKSFTFRLYDAQREQLSDASVEIKAYTQGLKKVEAQLVAHQQGQLWYEQKIKFMKIDLDDKTDVLTYHKKLLAKAQKEKDDLEVIVDKWNHSSKNLGKIVNHHMSARDKFGLGYGDYRYSGNLSYENEVFQSVFKSNKGDFENPPLQKTCEMQAVPPPMTGNYLPSGPDIEIDDSQYTYGPEKTQPSESESQTTELDTCNSNISTEPSELVSEPVVNESNIEVQPKVWSDAPIIEEYESDSDDEYVSVQTKGLDTPSFANKQVKTPRENVKNQSTHSQKPKVNNKELGHGFTERACFVCGSFSHLIRDCDYHVKLAKQVELNKQNMSKGNGTRERKPTWNNVQRVNKQNQFVPLAVQTRTGNNPVNTAKASSTNNFSTARQKVNKQTVLTSTALKVNTVKPIVNGVRPANVFHKTHSPSSRPFKRTTVLRTNFSNQKVYTVKVKEVSTVGGKWDTADNPHRSLKNKGIVDSGCSRHMTGNKAYLADFQDFNGGPVAFGVQDQTVLGKDKSNLLIADSLLKTIWFINAPCYDNEALASPNKRYLVKTNQIR
ncbi:hypothetical protein Tco_1113814 [Tanacetum coccineum]|uniref:Retrovirus-related Pol polyprotein from transposon TNT 1-94-like beta-barrel domain-containing protein n=1 Tax=Tanacetum coccineum TaxID=301880 RepID=A0ABQ5IT93_9ASTR